MKHFGMIRNIAAVATCAIVLFASLVVAQSDAHKSFDLLKGLEGNWAGKNQQGQPSIQVTFRMTAGGSALMSEILGKGPENMITMFHMDGDRLLDDALLRSGQPAAHEGHCVGREIRQLRILRRHQHRPRRWTYAARDLSRYLTPITTLKNGFSSIMAKK